MCRSDIKQDAHHLLRCQKAGLTLWPPVCWQEQFPTVPAEVPQTRWHEEEHGEKKCELYCLWYSESLSEHQIALTDYDGQQKPPLNRLGLGNDPIPRRWDKRRHYVRKKAHVEVDCDCRQVALREAPQFLRRRRLHRSQDKHPIDPLLSHHAVQDHYPGRNVDLWQTHSRTEGNAGAWKQIGAGFHQHVPKPMVQNHVDHSEHHQIVPKSPSRHSLRTHRFDKA
mmetsp:Transcript_68085/g.221692  ORF Transcript_68085/g.221692 Transcript_68085/m.221692 type:complete len:224 (+) Transcript_68085:936-1607(+)